MLKSALVALIALASLFTLQPAFAVTKSFVLNRPELAASSASYEQMQAIYLPPDDTGAIAVHLTLPGDYKLNSALTLQARMHTVDAGCNVVVIASGTFRYRLGAVAQNITDSTSGFSVFGSNVLTAPSPGSQVFIQTFKLKAASSGGILNQRAGDHVVAMFSRLGNDAQDTCPGQLRVTSVNVIYTPN